MIKYSFANDYGEGCHPKIFESLADTNKLQQPGYGEDDFTQQAKELIRSAVKMPKVAVHLIAGGTLTNLVVLSSILKPFESVIAAETGHIHTHEAGAVEATGHKIETVFVPDGKLRPGDIQPLLDNKQPLYHTVRPRVVYISDSTEIGTVYSKTELQELSSFCKKNSLLLFLDGARLIPALTALSNDLSLEDVARMTDVFYIGGTKCGALLGEAVVITNETIKNDFQYHLKQRGALLAKGRVLGIQFRELMKENLIFELARHANRMAGKMATAFEELGYSFLTRAETNQLFPILPYPIIERLSKDYEFFVWQPIDPGRAAVRFVTSWDTPEEAVDSFIRDLARIG